MVYSRVRMRGVIFVVEKYVQTLYTKLEIDELWKEEDV